MVDMGLLTDVFLLLEVPDEVRPANYFRINRWNMGMSHSANAKLGSVQL